MQEWINPTTFFSPYRHPTRWPYLCIGPHLVIAQASPSFWPTAARAQDQVYELMLDEIVRWLRVKVG